MDMERDDYWESDDFIIDDQINDDATEL